MSLNLSNLYEKNGFIEFENIFEKNTIDKWNKILDNSYQNHNNQKLNVDLADLGKEGYDILNDFFAYRNHSYHRLHIHVEVYF